MYQDETIKLLFRAFTISLLANIIFCGGVIYLGIEILRYPITCGSFSSSDEAQHWLILYPRLDRDHDGIACDNLK